MKPNSQNKRGIKMSKRISRIKAIIYFTIFFIFPEISFANYTVYFCDNNGHYIAQQTPCKEGTLIRTTTIYSYDGTKNEQKQTEQLSNSNLNEHNSTTIRSTQDSTNGNIVSELLPIPDISEIQKHKALIEAEVRAQIAAEEAEEQAEIAAKKAEEQAQMAAEEIEFKLRRERARSANNLYSVILLLFSGFFTYIIIKNKRGAPVNENQKYGLVVIISSFLLIVLVLMISEGWNYQLDFVENLMSTLFVLELPINIRDKYLPEYYYLIDLPSKYLVLGLFTTASYGFMTYLEIIRPFRLWKRNSK